MERKVVLFIAMSLDGYIADSTGDISWLSGECEGADDLEDYAQFESTIDTVILGRATYEQVAYELSPDVWPYEKFSSYVFTHKKFEPREGVEFIDADICEFVGELKKKEGKNIFICGGASLASKLVENKMVDIYDISIIPTLLGKGIKLFKEHESRFPLHLCDYSAKNGIVRLQYTNR